MPHLEFMRFLLPLLLAQQTTCSPLALPVDGKSLSGTVPPAEWRDYFFLADDDDYNLVFQVNASSDYANAIGIYVSEELPPLDDRLLPGQFLDFDAYSMIVIDGVRQYSIALAQCYIRKGQTYYLSIFGKNVVGSAVKPTVAYTASVQKVPARIPLNSTVSGSVCDGHYMHYYWELDSVPQSGGVSTFVGKTEGDLDAAYMRYEQCAGLASANLASIPLEGHGTPSGTIVLPQGSRPLDAGRYYVSVKGKPEICGDYSISATKISQAQLLESPASTWRRGGMLSMIVSVASMWLVACAVR